MPVRAAIYCRISLDQNEDGLAIERQLADCSDIAEAKKWEVTKIYRDTMSAYKKSKVRPAYNEMIADYEAGLFEAIVVWDLDRLTRQPRQLEDWIDRAEENGLKLVTANGEADLATDGGRLYARIKAAVARGEMETKSRRQKRAAQQRAEAGMVAGGPKLFGYTQTVQGTETVQAVLAGQIIEEEADIIRDVFDLFSKGASIYELAKRYERHSTTIRTWLTNPRYAGRMVRLGSVLEDVKPLWQGIVDPNLFDIVQHRLEKPERITNREGTERKHLGSSLYECSECGRALQTNGRRYWCRKGSHVARAMEPIDAMVIKAVHDRLSASDVTDLLSTEDDGELADLTAKATQLRNRLKVIEADYDAGNIDGVRFSAANSRVTTELSAVERERSTRLAGSTIGGLIAGPNPAEAFDAAPLSIKREVIRSFMWVVVFPTHRGSRGFDPDSVSIRWRRLRATVTEDGVHINVPQIPVAVKDLLSA